MATLCLPFFDLIFDESLLFESHICSYAEILFIHLCLSFSFILLTQGCPAEILASFSPMLLHNSNCIQIYYLKILLLVKSFCDKYKSCIQISTVENYTMSWDREGPRALIPFLCACRKGVAQPAVCPFPLASPCSPLHPNRLGPLASVSSLASTLASPLQHEYRYVVSFPSST